MAQRTHYVLVGPEAIDLYKESLKEFGEDATEKVAKLIKFDIADIFQFTEGSDDPLAFQGFIEQIDRWGEIEVVDKEFVDEINKLL